MHFQIEEGRTQRAQGSAEQLRLKGGHLGPRQLERPWRGIQACGMEQLPAAGARSVAFKGKTDAPKDIFHSLPQALSRSVLWPYFTILG